MKIRLGLEALGVLDGGKVRAAVDHELKHILKDCADRPGEKAARQVSIDINLVPEQDDTGIATTGQLEVVITSKVPNRRTKAYQFAIEENAKGEPEALFNDHSRTNVRQSTLDEVAEGSSAAVAKAAGEKVDKAKKGV